MKLKLLCCKALTRELSYLAAESDNNVDITYMRQGYHNAPELLNKMLQDEIDAVEGGMDPHTNENGCNESRVSPMLKEDFDAILIGYGLCSNGIVGLKSKKYPLVIPRGHDCISFFLGSKELYAKYFAELPGSFWYTASWIDSTSMPCAASRERELEYYREKGYDEEDIEFLLEENHNWEKEYRYACYIKMPFFHRDRYSDFTRDAAKHFSWEYREINGDMGLLERFISGSWNEGDFLAVPPGGKIIATGKNDIIGWE